jgi:branched-chain amino acid transport system ATP-binding protein
MPDIPMLAITDVTVRYGSVTAVADVSIDVAARSIHGVIGPNGAGKSTLMDTVCGARKPTAGRVVFNGRDITSSAIPARRMLGLARSFQRTNIFPGLTVREQLELVASRFPGSRIDDAVDALDLGSLLSRTASAIAYGDQRRVDIGLALLGSSTCLILDEPAAGLTAEETTVVFEHLAALVQDRGITALVVEHDVEAVFGFCDVVTVLDLGRVLVTDRPHAVRSHPDVITAYLGTAA